MSAGWVTLGALVLGALVWLGLVRRYDRMHPQQTRRLLGAFAVGGVALVLAMLGNEAFAALLGIGPGLGASGAGGTARAVVFALFSGLNEELCKALGAALAVRWFLRLDEPVDAMLAALTVALGFAVGENAVYAHQYGREVLLVRFLWPVPAHLAYAAVWGYGLARARFGPATAGSGAGFFGNGVFVATLVGAGVLHALANLALVLGTTQAALVSLSGLAGLLWLAHRHLLRLVAASPYLEAGECPECRNLNPEASPVCVYCGTTLRDPDFVRTCPACAFPRVPMRATDCPRCHTALAAPVPVPDRPNAPAT